MKKKIHLSLILLSGILPAFSQDKAINNAGMAANSEAGPKAATDTGYNRAVKIEFFAPLNNYVAVTYEQALKTVNSIEITLGMIGVGANTGIYNMSYGSYRIVRGGMMRLGWKHIFQGSYSRYDHDNRLHGFYVRPDILAGYYKQASVTISYFGNGTTVIPIIERRNQEVFYVSALVTIGKQWIVKNRFCIDIYGGAGYSVSSIPYEYWTERNYKGADFGSHIIYNIPLALTGGARLGFIMK